MVIVVLGLAPKLTLMILHPLRRVSCMINENLFDRNQIRVTNVGATRKPATCKISSGSLPLLSPIEHRTPAPVRLLAIF